MALPVLVTPVVPAPEQKAPGVTVAFAAAAVVVLAAAVVFVAAVVFGAAAVVLAVVAALVVGATAAVVGGAAVVAGALTDAAVGAVVAGLVVTAFIVDAAVVGRAGALTLALSNLGTCGLGVDVSGFAIAPTATRLSSPPATTPILTLRLSAFHRPARRVVSLLSGIW